MKDFDFGYFGTGDEGYAQYMTAFERNFSTDNTDSFASDDADCDADSCDSSEADFEVRTLLPVCAYKGQRGNAA